MINNLIHKKIEPIDVSRHGGTRLVLGKSDWKFSAGLNSIFVTAAEFGDACRDLPVVFVDAGKDDAGKRLVAPIAILGMVNHENLFVTDGRWTGRYIPAVLRAYPFCTAQIDADRFAVCFDAAYEGVSQSEGEALFTADGKPSPLLERVQKQLEILEGEVQRTRLMCDKLVELDLLREMRFDATLPDGRKHSVDGFLTVDHESVTALSDAKVLEIHRNGVLGLIHAHWMSLGNMRALMEQHLQRQPASQSVAGNSPAAS